MNRKRPEDLRSHRWLGVNDLRSFGHRSRLRQVGYDATDWAGKPVIGIINTWSDINPCHTHLRTRAEEVKRGVLQAGGFPIELPAMSLAEVFVKPTTMLYRNMLAMEVEELLRQHPIDGAVLLGGCDKTTPGMLMGAISMNLPTIYCPAGPMLNGKYRGTPVGAGTHTRKYWDDYRAGKVDEGEMVEIEGISTRSPGTCNTMGTASTMTSIVDALGLMLPGASSIPAMDSAHPRMASACGERIVEMVFEDLKPSDILTQGSLTNALHTDAALGGSTNAAVHLVAIARRAGLAIALEDFDRAATQTPVLANIFPAGNFLMEDLYFAGGLLGLMSRLQDRLDLKARNVTGGTLADALKTARIDDAEVIRPLDNPAAEGQAIAVLRGNLAPDGAVIKPSAASKDLLVHRGRAVVFDNHADLNARIDDPNLDIDENSVLVLRGAGPIGAPGFPEWGALPIPKKLLAKGIRDMVRISDARMSGTHYGTCVLHIAPESHVGGPLALVQTGDEIVLDVPNRRLEMLVSESELAKRRDAWVKPPARFGRGYGVIFQRHVTQADQGCDFDFLQSGPATAEPDIF